MKTKWVPTILLVLSIGISGCAAAGHSPSTSPTTSMDLQPVKLQIAMANRHLEQGDPEKAQAAYQLLIDTCPKLPIHYRVGLLTNAALASLQLGDGYRFAAYARQLETIASGLRPLPRNTQIVLAMMDVSGLRNTDAELWITQPVERAVRTALTTQ